MIVGIQTQVTKRKVELPIESGKLGRREESLREERLREE